VSGKSLPAAALALSFAAAMAVVQGTASGQGGTAPLFTEGSAAAEPWVRYRGWNPTVWDSYNSLAARQRTPPPGSPVEIKGAVTGDARKGRELAFSRVHSGGCLPCHVMGPQTPETPGNVGPDLSEIGAAGRPDVYLFNAIYDPRTLNPDTSMPPWGAHGFYSREQIGHLVAFLKTLTKPADFANPLDDPGRRPKPVEDRDALDPFVNPAAERIEVGRALAAAPGANGKSCLGCHADAEQRFANWSVGMPRWQPQMQKMLGVEEFVYRHARATTGAQWRMQGTENTDMSIWLYSLANGREIRVDTESPSAKAVFELGRTLYQTKIGQLNFACTDCHSPEKGGNKWLRGQFLGEAGGQLDHFPTWRTSRGAGEIWDVRKRLQWCNVQVRANELPPDAPEYDALELYVKAQSTGYRQMAPNIRH
jgi:sulfur-oxidizing protein SoxA